jgi:hypothetical protein
MRALPDPAVAPSRLGDHGERSVRLARRPQHPEVFMSTRSLAPLAGALLLIAGVLAGCATGAPGAAPTATPTSEPTATAVEQVDVQAGWLDGGAMVGVVVSGSSSCLPMADATSYADGVMSVSLIDPVDAPCTRDLVPRGIAVPTPAGVDASADLRVEVTGAGYAGTAEIAAAPGLVPGGGLESGEPSAGWIAPDAFVVLTWGSSSCRPQVEDAAVTGPAEIAVGFVAPPADQVCTADFGPRVTVVPVEGAAAGTAYQAVLTGEAPATVAIAGTP